MTGPVRLVAPILPILLIAPILLIPLPCAGLSGQSASADAQPERAAAQRDAGESASAETEATAADGQMIVKNEIRPPRQGDPPFTISAHAQFGRLSQTASDSFNAILGTSTGRSFGGGVELTLRSGFFARLDVSRFAAEGQRVDSVDGQIVPLGIPLSISLLPVELTGGYRLRPYVLGRRRQMRLVPFVGGGVGSVAYHEETDAAHPEERVSERYTSYHLLGGVDVPLGRRVALGVEAAKRWIPDGMGNGGISQEFGESDLGGATLRLRVRLNF